METHAVTSSSSGREKEIWFVRHAEGFHNSTQDQSIPDPMLTPRGRLQCKTLRESPRFKGLFSGLGINHRPELLVVSPMRRTLETADLLLGAEAMYIDTILQPLLQEISATPSDTGSHPGDLESIFENAKLAFDFESLPISWSMKSGLNSPTMVAVRANKVAKWLMSRTEDVIMIIGHGAMFRAMLGEAKGDWFQNAEIRKYALHTRGGKYAYRREPDISPKARITRFFFAAPPPKSSMVATRDLDDYSSATCSGGKRKRAEGHAL